MKFKLRNPLSVNRMYLTVSLVFFESILVPLQGCLQSGHFPSDIEFLSYVVTGSVQAITLLLAFVKKEVRHVKEV